MTKREAYNYICKRADALFKKYNPCRIKNGVCVNSYYKTCCCEVDYRTAAKCKYAGTSGCKTQNLSCKLFLCDALKPRLHQIRMMKGKYWKLWVDLVELQTLADKYNLRHYDYFECKTSCLQRSSKRRLDSQASYEAVDLTKVRV